MGTYYTPAAPTVQTGYLLQAESRVLLGTEYGYGSLETSSATYTSYGASIGLQSGKSIDLGLLGSLSFTHTPTYEQVEAANLSNSTIYSLTGEETTVTVGLRQFNPEVLNMALGTGTKHDLADNETLITFGGDCDMITRPLSIEGANNSCYAPDTPANGITGYVLTLYDTFVNNGLQWDDINASNFNEISIEFRVRPMLSNSRGNRLGCLYLF